MGEHTRPWLALQCQTPKSTRIHSPILHMEAMVWHRFCGFGPGAGEVPELADSIILSHWGLSDTEVPCPWPQRLRSFDSCPTRKAALSQNPPKRLPCFVPNKVRFAVQIHCWASAMLALMPETNTLKSSSIQLAHDCCVVLRS